MSDLIYAYADESGDTGYQFDAASSPRFVLGIVIAEQPEQMIDNRVFAAVIHKQHAPRDFRKQGKLGLYSHAIAGLCLRASIEFKHCKLLAPSVSLVWHERFDDDK